MKKTYINPVVEIVMVQPQQILAASALDVTKENTFSSTGATGAALGRDFDFDDDED